jgi:hypothetical protein
MVATTNEGGWAYGPDHQLRGLRLIYVLIGAILAAMVAGTWYVTWRTMHVNTYEETPADGS